MVPSRDSPTVRRGRDGSEGNALQGDQHDVSRVGDEAGSEGKQKPMRTSNVCVVVGIGGDILKKNTRSHRGDDLCSFPVSLIDNNCHREPRDLIPSTRDGYRRNEEACMHPVWQSRFSIP